jgi:hypothetical protein
MATIDFKALYAEAKRAAAASSARQGQPAAPRMEAERSTLPAADASSNHEPNALGRAMVEEIEEECVHLGSDGRLAVDELAPFRVGGDVPAAYYLPNFISRDEEQRLLSDVRTALGKLLLRGMARPATAEHHATRSMANPKHAGRASSADDCRCGVPACLPACYVHEHVCTSLSTLGGRG